MKDFSILEKKLDIKFKNKDLLIQAFVHRSYLNENLKFHLEHNERLEFLGDAVLELIITDYLYKKYPEKPEGMLTSLRASLVNTNMLSTTSEEIGFNEFLLLSRGEAKETGKARYCILADTFESFVGSLYLDQGYATAEKFILKYLVKKLPHIIETGLFKDAKSKFQEQAQENIGFTPVYEVLKEFGPDHAKYFTIGVLLDNKVIAKGKGSSKQEAEEDAAKNALKIKGWKK
ncbi:MAG: ribonuclease III [Patescibacteria group bacterium]|nr:ribonuclease III [Patescibacteria group bacterium]